MTKVVAIFSIGALAFLTISAPTQAKDLVLVEKGQPEAVIVTAEGASEKARLAAEDLQTYLRKMTGANLEIVFDSASPKGAAILVGQSKLTRAMKAKIPEGLSHARREEGFLILCKGSRLVLAGNDEGPYHGTEYAVYEFLRRLGVRWFMPGDFGEDVPQENTVAFPEMQILEKPDFVMRNWWLHAKPELLEQERRWKIRNKMNPEEFFATPGDSSVRNVVGDEKVFKEHPEYFALNLDGTRNPHLPNLTHPKAVEIAANIIKDYFRKNPNANSYGFAPDDGLPRDFNPETVKLNQGFVELGGRPGVLVAAPLDRPQHKVVTFDQ